jgi:ABC-2 type transport system ATP-binding protein
MADDAVIQVTNVGKQFRLPHDKTTSIKGAVVNFYRRKRTFENQQALKDISFTVQPGEFFGIVGRNGSGKSTLLKLLAGIYSPTTGKIAVRGRLTPFIELGVGFNPELSGRENVYLNGALLGFGRKEMHGMYEDIVDFAELERFMDQKLKNYSSGMQVRLAFSIAIRARGDILLLDEVLAVGDAAFQKKCYEHFMLLKKNKRTVVLVTHDMGAVRQYCDRAIMIEKGSVVESGSPEVVAQAYQRLFVDEAAEKKSKAKPVLNKDKKRWGSGEVLATDTSVDVGDKVITVKVTYKAKAPVGPPIFGFSIHDSAGVNIVETNTQRELRPTAAMKVGSSTSIVWSFPNVLKSGNYNLHVACCDQSAVDFYDWLNEAESFSVDRIRPTAGIIAPEITINDYTVK